MKTAFVTALLLLPVLHSFAQATYGIKPRKYIPHERLPKRGLDLELKVGANLSTVFWQEAIGARNVKVNPNPGLHGGLVVDIPVTFHSKAFSIQPGILYSQKGYRSHYTHELYGKGTLIVSPRYIEIPMNVVYYLPTKTRRLYAGAGGYLSYGIGGNWSIEYSGGRDAGLLEFVKVEEQNDYDDRFNYGKKTDMGVNCLVGYQALGVVALELSGQVGLKNIAPAKSNNVTFERFRNAGLMLSVILSLGN